MKGFENVVIISTWGDASEFPAITMIASDMHAYSASFASGTVLTVNLSPKRIITANVINDSSSAIALSRNCGSPKGIAIAPPRCFYCHKHNDNRSKGHHNNFFTKNSIKAFLLTINNDL